MLLRICIQRLVADGNNEDLVNIFKTKFTILFTMTSQRSAKCCFGMSSFVKILIRYPVNQNFLYIYYRKKLPTEIISKSDSSLEEPTLRLKANCSLNGVI